MGRFCGELDESLLVLSVDMQKHGQSRNFTEREDQAMLE
jgi:hypothetical protein